jgi:CCR4-NOT transcription complex subunit 1
MFMPKLLLSEDREVRTFSTMSGHAPDCVYQGWAAFYKLLLSLLRFIAPFLKATSLKQASRDLYRGTLRILLVLLHDFPDFLSEYYFSLCDVIPSHCIQLRNIILSAYPMHITLPDPHGALTAEPVFYVGTIPPILSDFSSHLKPGDLRVYLDQYLLGRGNSSLPTTLKNRLLLTTPAEDGSEAYNLSLMNALVMYIGVSSVAQAKARSGSSFFNTEDPGVVLLKFLAEDLDAEG